MWKINNIPDYIVKKVGKYLAIFKKMFRKLLSRDY